MKHLFLLFALIVGVQSECTAGNLKSVTKTRGEWKAILVQLSAQNRTVEQDQLFHAIASALDVPNTLDKQIADAELALSNAAPHGPSNEVWTAAKRYLEMLERQKVAAIPVSDKDVVNVIEFL